MSDWVAEPSDLREADAVSWYRDIDADAPHLLDSAIVTIGEVFGSEVDVAAIVPADERGEGTFLFLAVAGDISDDDTWQRLVDAHRADTVQGLEPSESRERLRIVIAEVPEARSLRKATQDWFSR